MEIVAPLVISRPTPRSAVNVASVMIKGGKPSLLIRNDDRGPNGKAVCQQPGNDNACEAYDSADREINARRYDDESLAYCKDGGHRALAKQVGEVAVCPEAVGAERQRQPHQREEAHQGQAEQRAHTRLSSCRGQLRRSSYRFIALFGFNTYLGFNAHLDYPLNAGVLIRRRSASDPERLRQNCLMQRLLADMGAVMSGHKPPAAKHVQCVRKIVDLRQVGRDQDDSSASLQQFGK
jgi:hypothetical protein